MTAFWRALGDPVSRLDRFETAMNLVPPGEERDTTSPEAMARSVARFVLGDVLTPASRASLRDWMAHRHRQPPHPRRAAGGRAPLVVAVYLEANGYCPETRAEDEDVLRSVGVHAILW
jgi:beta-lactamase class A